jgi:uronate dehydrogenase
MPNARKVVVTGSAGRIGRATVSALTAAGHTVTGFDRVPTPGLPVDRYVVGDIADRTAVASVVRGANCVIHLAATPDDPKRPDGSLTYDPDHFPHELVPNNILGTYAVLEAVRLANTPRVILASSGQVVDGYLDAGEFPVAANADCRPFYLYACTKVMLESLGRVYAQHHGLSVLAVRLGWCPRDANQVKEIAGDELSQDVFLSPGDAGRFFTAAVEAASLPPFATLFATSRFSHLLRYDLSETKRLLNWEPKDQWPEGADMS